MPQQPDARALDAAVAALLPCRRLVALTGAGASTESGLPDFRSPQGLYRQRGAEDILSLSYFTRHPDRFWEFYLQRLLPMHRAQPNDGHRALADLERAGHLAAVLTQNIDGLHRAAGSRVVFELHGNVRHARCEAGHRRPMEGVLREMGVQPGDPGEPGGPGAAGATAAAGAAAGAGSGSAPPSRDPAGAAVPLCPVCGRPVRPDTVLFEEPLDPDVWRRATIELVRCDGLLIVGTSLQVEPVASLPEVALQRGVPLVIVNREPTPLDLAASALLRSDAAPALAALSSRLLATWGPAPLAPPSPPEAEVW